jgi:hypothetical protein
MSLCVSLYALGLTAELLDVILLISVAVLQERCTAVLFHRGLHHKSACLQRSSTQWDRVHCFVGYSPTLSASILRSVTWHMDGELEWLWPNLFSYRNWGKARNTSVRIAGVPTEILTRHSHSTVEPTKPPINIATLFVELKWLGCEAYNSLPSRAEVKNDGAVLQFPQKSSRHAA